MAGPVDWLVSMQSISDGVTHFRIFPKIRKILQILSIGVSKIHSLYMYLLCVYVRLLLLCVSE